MVSLCASWSEKDGEEIVSALIERKSEVVQRIVTNSKFLNTIVIIFSSLFTLS